LELSERLATAANAPALLKVVESPPGESDRAMFVAGRACEVLLKLPLDLETRAKADALCRVPLEEVSRFRLGAQRARQLHRPRLVEWALLIGLMVIGLLGVWFA